MASVEHLRAGKDAVATQQCERQGAGRSVNVNDRATRTIRFVREDPSRKFYKDFVPRGATSHSLSKFAFRGSGVSYPLMRRQVTNGGSYRAVIRYDVIRFRAHFLGLFRRE